MLSALQCPLLVLSLPQFACQLFILLSHSSHPQHALSLLSERCRVQPLKSERHSQLWVSLCVCVCFSIHPVESKINGAKVASGTPGFLHFSATVLHHVSHKDSQRHPGFESTMPCADVLIFLSSLMCDCCVCVA